MTLQELEGLLVVRSVMTVWDALGDDEIRASAIAYSLFTGIPVRYSEMVEFVRTEELEGYLASDGERILLTLEGSALVSALAESEIGQSKLQQLKSIERSLKDSRGALTYINRFAKQVQKLIEARERRVLPLENPVVLCSLLLNVEPISRMFETRLMLPSEFAVSDSPPWREVALLEERLVKATGQSVRLTIVTPGELSILSLVPIEDVEFGGTGLKGNALPVDPAKVGPLLVERAIDRLIEKKMVRAGYARIGRSHREFSKFNRKNTGSKAQELPSVRFVTDALSAETLLVWAEEFMRPILRAIDIIEVGDDNTIVENSIRERRLVTLPYGSNAELIRIIGITDMSTSVVPGTNLTYEDYWEKRNIPIEERVQPLLLMRTPSGEFSYPAEMVLIRREIGVPGLGRNPRVMSPSQRLAGLKQLSNAIFGNGTVVWEGLSIRCIGIGPRLSEINLEERPKAISLPPPLLRFAGDRIGYDPIQVFDFGPYAGMKDVFISHIFYPSNVQPYKVEKAISTLSESFKKLRLGSVRLTAESLRISYDSEAAQSSIANLVRRYARKSTSISIGLVITNQIGDAYFSFKRYFTVHNGSPLQAFTTDSLDKLLAGNRGILRLLSLNLYLKLLTQNESAWILATPAGGSQKTSFLGLGFSRALNPLRAGKGAAVMHDAMGLGLSWKMLLMRGERTIDEAWFTDILNQLDEAVQENPTSRLVIYRAGRMDEVERKAITRAIEAKKTSWNKPLEFVLAIDEHRRFFVEQDGRISNPHSGCALLWRDGTVLLAESGFSERQITRGTVVPVSLHPVLSSTSSEQLASEYHDQSHLSWSSPGTTWKQPLVLRISEKLAEAAREGVPASAIRFLPL